MTVTREVDVEGRRLRLSNADRLLWPDAGFTKGQMLDYYAAVAPVLLPHLDGRPVTLGRWPEGVNRPGWFQAECRGRPDWLPVREIVGRQGQVFSYCLVNDLPSLLFLANLGTIEFHPFLWRLPAMDPSYLVFDLDPGPPASLPEACRVALLIRELLASVGLHATPKTSGSLGLHLLVPLAAGQSFAQSKAFVRSIARWLAAREPELVVDRVARSERTGRVFIDWVQNVATRSTVAPYSLRATAWPLVATPVTWAEVEKSAHAGRPELLRFGPADALRRIERLGDVAAPLLATGGAVLPVEIDRVFGA